MKLFKFKHLDKKLPEIDKKCLQSVSSNMALFLLIGSLVLWLGTFAVCLWRMYKMKVGFKAMKPLGRIIHGKPGEGDVSKIEKVISDILSLNTPPQPTSQPVSSLPALPSEPTRCSQLPVITPPAITPEVEPRVSSTPPGTSQQSRSTVVAFDILKHEQQA